MPEALNIDQELRSAKLQPISLRGTSAYRLENRTPAHVFTTVVVHFKDAYYLATTARDFFDEDLAKGLFDFVSAHGKEVDGEKVSQMLEGFSHPSYAFNAVMILSPQAHKLFRVQSKTLHSRTLEIFPIYRCEFSGTEAPELIELIRHDFVSTIDWKRMPSPQIRMSFSDTCTGVRSTGKKPGLAKLSVLDDKVRRLIGCPGSVIEVENFRGDHTKFSAENGKFVLSLPGSAEKTALSADGALRWLREFLIEGSKRVASA